LGTFGEAAGFNPNHLDTLRSRTSAAYRGLYVLLQREGTRDFFWKARMTDLDLDDVKLDIHHIFLRKWCEESDIPPLVFNAIVNKTAVSHKANRKSEEARQTFRTPHRLEVFVHLFVSCLRVWVQGSARGRCVEAYRVVPNMWLAKGARSKKGPLGPKMKQGYEKRGRGRPQTLDRQRTVEVAMTSFWCDGVRDVSMNEICRRANVSKPGVYLEFGNEDGLTEAAV
jgi:hypothetical protein